ncbi:MazG nucleotide pyrophosphohydrolase domain-containing protein [Nocardioides sp.]|uniref:MazG nucleotide pyrophosphohydrolase domain-containing protein n=1 Tax=Nocardioides sp. TaxID=35761 RepID=UPI0039E42C45
MADRATGEGLVEFLDLMRLLRERCAWKASQSHASLAKHLREEADEVLEAIDEGDPEHLRDELGDLLLQVYFHAAIAEEAGEFTMDDVVAGLAAKMRRRNPHVFDPAYAGQQFTVEEIEELWQAAKAKETR